MNAKDTICVHKAPEEQNQHLIKRTKEKKITLSSSSITDHSKHVAMPKPERDQDKDWDSE